MVDNIKITALTAIGANIAYTTLVPVVNMTGTPLTQKATAQDLGNLILSGAGGSYFVRAAQSNLALSVANAAQPNITSVGTLTSLAVIGNITAGNINGGNIVVANFYSGDGGFLTNVYSNSSVANYLPAYTGNVGAGNVNVTGTVYANGISSTGLASLTTLNVSTTANLGAVGNVRISGGSNGQVLTTNGNGVLSWTNDANSSYGNSNVVSLMAAFGSNTITTTGNVAVGNIIGNGQALTGIAGANVSGFVPNANVANTAFAVAGANVTGTVPSATTAGTVTTNAQPNITSVGTLTSLAVTGNASAGNLTTTGQLISSVATGTAPLAITSTTRVSNLNVDYANVADNINVTAPGTGTGYVVFANATTGNIVEWTSLGITSNLANNSITATTFIGALANGNSNVNIATANGNVTIAAVGNTTMTVTGTGANITGTANITGNANVGNLGTAQVLATANIAAPQLISNIATGTAPLVVTSTTQVANLSVATAGSATTAGTVTTAAQPNITSVGTLTSLAVTGNANVGNLNATTAVIASTLTSNVATGTAPLTVTSTTRVANLNVDYANVADFMTVAAGTGNNFLVFANAATGNVSEVTSTGLTANLSNNSITATTFVGALANGNSNVNIATANGNVTIAAVGNTTMTVTGTGANITGTLNVTGNITGNTAGFAIGYLNIPQVAAANATLALTDAGKHYYSTSAGNFTLTIPSDASVGFSTGSAISVVVQSAGNVLVNAAAGVTLYMAGNSTAANRVVSNYGMATLLKVATDTWMINGTGVS